MACAAAPPDAVTSPTLACGPDPYSYFPKWEERLRYTGPGPITRGEFRDDKLTPLLDAYNAVPPQTDLEADAAYTYLRPGSPRALMVFTLNDCIVASGTISLSQLMMWLENVKGRPMPPPGSLES